MDDFKIILYILAAVAYFLFTQWRKAFQTPDEQQDVEPRPQRKKVMPQQPPKPVTSFEDILRELQPKAERREAEAGAPMEMPREVVPPVIRAEPVPKYRSYEQNVPKVLSWEKKAEAIEAQKRSMERRQPVFKSYTKEQEEPAYRYARMLRNPATVRDAVILTEIFNRKYT